LANYLSNDVFLEFFFWKPFFPEKLQHPKNQKILSLVTEKVSYDEVPENTFVVVPTIQRRRKDII